MIGVGAAYVDKVLAFKDFSAASLLQRAGP
jgi:hypothetical protein